jgi:hypothetical protein
VLVPVDYIDLVRCDCYPFDAPQGPEYERGAVARMLRAIGFIRGGRAPACGAEVEAVRDEVLSVFEACLKASGL